MKKATITYRFDRDTAAYIRKDHNGAERRAAADGKQKDTEHFQTVQKVRKDDRAENENMRFGQKEPDYQLLNSFTSDYGAWESPIEREAEKLEKMIRESGTARKDYADGEEPVHEEMFYPRYIKHARPPYFKIFASLTGAVITGIMFGFFVLSLFTGDVPEGTRADQAAVSEQGQVTETGSQAEPGAPAPAEDGAQQTAFVSFPAQSYFLLQHGVFNSLEGAETAAATLSGSGFAAATEAGDQYRVYAGIATDRDDALLLSYRLQEKKLETYIKAYEIPQSASIPWNAGSKAAAENYFTQGGEIVKMISALSMIHLRDSAPSSPDDTSLAAIAGVHRAWTESAAEMEDDVPEPLKAAFQKMNNSVNTAVVSLEEYRKNPAFTYLWQAQSALMQYVILQKEFLSQLARQS
jgi:stage II sporulation protein B